MHPLLNYAMISGCIFSSACVAFSRRKMGNSFNPGFIQKQKESVAMSAKHIICQRHLKEKHFYPKEAVLLIRQFVGKWGSKMIRTLDHR